MALTGLQIQKLLPGTNCRDCGSNTCMAFAMKLASKKAELSECPHASEEAKRVLGAAGEPPVRTVALGPDKRPLLGGETVLYRHEKTFVNPTAIAVNLDDTLDDASFDASLKTIADYRFERVGETFAIELIAITNKSGDAARFEECALRCRKKAGVPMVLRSADSSALERAAAALSGFRSVLCVPSPDSADALIKAAKEHGHALAVAASDIDGLAALSSSLRESGFNDIVLDLSTATVAESFQLNSILRRAAIRDGVRPAGHPFIRWMEEGDGLDGVVAAVTEITKYGGIIVLPSFDAAMLSALMTLRLNIFTDPQKPIQVEPGIYPIGEPGPDSPVFLTTNFSLTYFVVSGEIENSGTSAWLVVPECEGMSVLTAWAAGKFSAATVSKFIAETDLASRVNTRQIVIPGFVSQISGELEEKLPGWKVLVGPQEAADIESFVKTRL
ncbi:MAG TPA: acetyl-CoA decarbonylase/synthase complex subunit gamma [Spirochaetota bacterium]|nr:MAG: Corrinoid/iron-sulfur protein large subunit [Spirochaetes bacterium ADurb.BinA120]HPI13519.1 acetyl-CoA decarbonylase/synthase complex subunit gamma [Spirochaetota bacterium]HPO46004.1 acetyl-CoA decarbonylase/synthase complex subunit gamma [Spirochaetota bacterium]